MDSLKHRELHLITYGLGKTFVHDKFQPVKNIDSFKPTGGLWASPIKSKYGWREWCQDNNFGSLDTHFVFRYSGNVLKIEQEDHLSTMTWKKIYETIEWPDYEAMYDAGVDAIWLTAKGQIATRFTYPRNLYGWDCECVLVMNPKGIQFKTERK